MIIRFFDKETLTCKGEFSRFSETTQTKYINAIGTFSVVTDYIPQDLGLEDIIFVSGPDCEEYCGQLSQISGSITEQGGKYTFQGREIVGLLSERMPLISGADGALLPLSVNSVKRESAILSILDQLFTDPTLAGPRCIEQITHSNSLNRGATVSYTCAPDKSALDSLYTLALPENWGLELIPNFETRKYDFQIIIPEEKQIAISAKFDNLVNEQFTLSRSAHKNVAYYSHTENDATTYGCVDPDSAEGFSRKERWITASTNLSEAQARSVIIMQLGNFKPTEHFTGDYRPSETFIFGQDFTLGDFVQYSGSAGTAKKQVIGFTQTYGAGAYTKQLLFGDNLRETVRAIRQIEGGK